MRDLAIAAIILASCFYALKTPYIGFLTWTWLSLMNPHKLAFGWIQTMPVAQVTILSVFIGMFVEKDRGKIVPHGIAVLQVMFCIWMVLSQLFAMEPLEGWTSFTRAEKIQISIFFSYLFINSKKKLNWLLWVMFLSVGFYGVKGGIFTLSTGGSSKVWGPDGSFIGDNNHLACALLMNLPIGLYLMSITTHSLIRKGMIAAIALIGISVLGSASRGAFLGLMSVCLYWMKNVPGKQKLLAVAISLFLAVIAVTVMPQSWWDRMNTVKTYEQDASAMGRINAWWCAYNVAKDRITGAGFNYYSKNSFALYAPDPLDVHAAHSVYFQILGELGFIGLILYLSIAFWTWLVLGRIIRNTKNNPDLSWANNLARCIQLSLIAYFSAGAFLSLSYYDYYWQLIGIAVILNVLIKDASSKLPSNPEGQPALPKPKGQIQPFVRPCKPVSAG